jgi:nicotinate phosphoribosyltransferase
MNAIQFADFGTRRAKSPEHHAAVVDIFAGSLIYKNFIGSSNVELALYHNIKVIGTYAHEWISGNAVMFGYAQANLHAMENWVATYNGDLGIALTDTFTTDAFLQDFDSKYANLFTGVRHDSEDPFIFTDKIINHYKKLGIDPTTKTIVYSNALDSEMTLKIAKYRNGEIRKSYGIGTFLTNDIPNVKAMNIVIKLVELNGIPAIKLSDSPEKHVGDAETIKFVKWQLHQRHIS